MSDKEQQLAEAMAAYERGVQSGVISKEKDRAMSSSTFKALAAQMVHPVSEWSEDLLDEIVEDVIVINKDRMYERAIWLFVVIVIGVGAAVAAWNLKPDPPQENIEWSCTRTYDDAGPDAIECTGVDI